MKKMKQFVAVLLTLAMVLGMTVMTFADIGDAPENTASAESAEPEARALSAENTAAKASVGYKPQPSDKAYASVANVVSGAAVTAYRIVEPTYGPGGFTGYRAASGTGIVNAVEPTSDEVTSIAANTHLLNTLETASLYPEWWVDENNLTTYHAQLGAGYWLVIVTPYGGAATEIYNPMLLGVYYTSDGAGGVTGGAINADSNWSLNSEPAYAKSQEPTIDKRIIRSSGKDMSDGNEKGNDVAVGDTVSFLISAQIPGYSKAYRDVRVEISDQLGKGFTLASPAGITVRVGATTGQAIEVVDGAYTYSQYDNKSFRVNFYSDYALAHAGENVYITYDAVLAEDAGFNFDANTNTARLEYTNNPQYVYQTTAVEDRTYTYTFGLDSSLYGDNGYPWNQVTRELIKTGEPRNVSGSAVSAGALSGAVFTLTSTGSAIGKVYAATSDALGYLSFTGLDAGRYYLQEVMAPEGYSLNEMVIPVDIMAYYNGDGTLSGYTVIVDGQAYSHYYAEYQTYKINGTTKMTEIKNVSSSAMTYEIKNTKLTGLPSTGGMGTTIFTIVGCAVMILAAAMFFASRRKSAK